MKKSILSFILLFVTGALIAQVPQAIVVEHFTNTRCSVCASRNPGFYTNLNAQDNVLHMAIHPSSPYSACLLNQHNKVENDARTNYYGVYGSTPRLVIQGNVVPSSSNYGSATIFDAYKNQTTPLSLTISVAPFSVDSIQVRAVVKTEAAHNLGALQLFVSLVEEELIYGAPNGEATHYNVFRKSFFPATGLAFNAPSSIGDSAVFTGVIAKNGAWVLNQMYALGIINQASDKKAVQAAKSANLQGSTGLFNYNTLESHIYPNPSSDVLQIELEAEKQTQLSLYDFSGRLVKQHAFEQTITVDVRELPVGIYQVVLVNGNQQSSQKIIITK
jgi:hypothetical protein